MQLCLITMFESDRDKTNSETHEKENKNEKVQKESALKRAVAEAEKRGNPNSITQKVKTSRACRRTTRNKELP